MMSTTHRVVPFPGRARIFVVLEETLLAQIVLAFRIIYRIFLALVLALFLHFCFLHQYLPERNHSFPVHLVFDPCNEAHDDMSRRCSSLSSNVSLIDDTKRSVLTNGQVYNITVRLDLPESDVNYDIGMFMICLRLFDDAGEVVWPLQSEGQRCRSTMLMFKTNIFKTLESFVRLPKLIFGNNREHQVLSVILDTQFKDNPRWPTTRAEVSVLSRHLQVYATELKFDSEYTGLHHIISSYPILLSSFGFLVNFSIIFLLLLIGDLACLTSVFDPVYRDHAIKLFCHH